MRRQHGHYAAAPRPHLSSSLALSLALSLSLPQARRFEFLNLGLLAYLGGGEALSQVHASAPYLSCALPARIPASRRKSHLSPIASASRVSQVQVGEQKLLTEAGSTGFLLWRSVYVVKQVSPRTRFLVLFDWLKTKIFGRDVTRW